MSDTLPNEVREAMARAVSWATDGSEAWERYDEIYRDEYRAEIDSALSALEAAGFRIVKATEASDAVAD